MKIRTPCRPALHDAAKDGNMSALREALAAPGDVDRTYLGQAAIHLAAKGGHVDSVALLLERGANLHARATNTGSKNSRLVWDMGGATPLHCAAEMDHTDVISLLLQYGAELDARAKLLDTPLHFAAREGHLASTKLLVAKGADVHLRNESGATPCDEANQLGGGKCACEDLSSRQWGAVAAFLTQVAPMAAEPRRAFALKLWERPSAAMLHDAAETGAVAQLRRLIAVGCNVDAKDYDGSAALHAAAEGGSREAAALLIEAHASVNATNNYQDTAMIPGLQ